MEIKDSLNRKCVCFLTRNTKTEAISQLVDLLKTCGKIDDVESIKEKLLYREKLMSTGIGLGLGIPHIRTEMVTEPVMAVGICKEGISDYDSIDNKPVWVVLLIIAGKDQHRQYIKLMSQAVTLLKEPGMIETLKNSTTSEEIYKIFAG
ncbi:PTS sugar transporter subunit IIA [bacterium]|nr:PTS sugar transporter subunit IIA [bacterium]